MPPGTAQGASVPTSRLRAGSVPGSAPGKVPPRPAHIPTGLSPQVKQQDNGVALKCFQRVIRSLDALGWEERQLALVKGLLAGNVFDWGAKAVSE